MVFSRNIPRFCILLIKFLRHNDWGTASGSLWPTGYYDSEEGGGALFVMQGCTRITCVPRRQNVPGILLKECTWVVHRAAAGDRPFPFEGNVYWSGKTSIEEENLFRFICDSVINNNNNIVPEEGCGIGWCAVLGASHVGPAGLQ